MSARSTRDKAAPAARVPPPARVARAAQSMPAAPASARPGARSASDSRVAPKPAAAKSPKPVPPQRPPRQADSVLAEAHRSAWQYMIATLQGACLSARAASKKSMSAYESHIQAEEAGLVNERARSNAIQALCVYQELNSGPLASRLPPWVSHFTRNRERCKSLLSTSLRLAAMAEQLADPAELDRLTATVTNLSDLRDDTRCLLDSLQDLNALVSERGYLAPALDALRTSLLSSLANLNQAVELIVCIRSNAHHMLYLNSLSLS